MEFYETVKKRHSARKFKDKNVEKKKIQRIMDAMSMAPSAGNLQAYRVYAVKGKEKKKMLAEAALDQDYVAEAPVCLVFCADRKRSALKYGERGENQYCLQDATIAAAYTQLAATEEGLSTVWVGAFDPIAVAQIINVEEFDFPVTIMPLGYSDEEPEKTERRSLEKIIREVD